LNSWELENIVMVLCLIVPALSGCAEESKQPERLIEWAESFAQDAESSTERKLPIVVFVSQRGCQFCAALRKQVLFPMIRADELADVAIIRELSLDAGFAVADFNGSEIEGRTFADRYRAAVTPTMLFLDADGVEIADKIVGISNIEFYGFYLNRSIEAARLALNRSPSRSQTIALGKCSITPRNPVSGAIPDTVCRRLPKSSRRHAQIHGGPAQIRPGRRLPSSTARPGASR